MLVLYGRTIWRYLCPFSKTDSNLTVLAVSDRSFIMFTLGPIAGREKDKRKQLSVVCKRLLKNNGPSGLDLSARTYASRAHLDTWKRERERERSPLQGQHRSAPSMLLINARKGERGLAHNVSLRMQISVSVSVSMRLRFISVESPFHTSSS